MTTHTLRFISDPGHGWLEVPVGLLAKLGIADQISPYSYQRKDVAYLEEDCDLSVFMAAARNAGITVTMKEEHQNHTFIRDLPSYEGPSV